MVQKEYMQQMVIFYLLILRIKRLMNNYFQTGLLQEMIFYFDFIIIDSPPVVPVSDPLLIADQVDGIILVVKAGSTQREVVNRAINLLSNSGLNPLGIVVNDYEEVLPYYYKDHYYGYRYWPEKSK